MRNVFIIIRTYSTDPLEQGFIEYVEGDSEAVHAFQAQPEHFVTWLKENGWKPSLLPEPLSISHERYTYTKA